MIANKELYFYFVKFMLMRNTSSILNCMHYKAKPTAIYYRNLMYALSNSEYMYYIEKLFLLFTLRIVTAILPFE
jgi:hypothetical protein